MPGGPLKDCLTDLYYRVYYNPKHYRKNGFFIRYRDRAFEYVFQSGVRIRTCENLEDEIRRSLLGYIAMHDFRRGETVLDCGAESGEFALYAARSVGGSGKVIVFEPDPVACATIMKNLAINRLDNVQVVNKGVWSIDTVLNYDENKRMLTKDPAHTGNAARVEVASIDNELGRMGVDRVDFIKMDVEGSEIEAIKGAAGTIDRFKPEMAIASYHEICGVKSHVELESMLGRLGYSVETGHPRHLTTYAAVNKK